MRYVEFKEAIDRELKGKPTGLTWRELQQRLDLPYDRPCPTWTKRLESDIRLSRIKLQGPALIWRVPASRRNS